MYTIKFVSLAVGVRILVVARRALGRVSERSAVLLLCAVDGELAHVRQIIDTATCLLLEQFSTMKCFNVIGYLSYLFFLHFVNFCLINFHFQLHW